MSTRAARPRRAAAKRGASIARREVIKIAVDLAARAYFDISYLLLSGSVSGRQLLALAGLGGGPVHGYSTSEDLDALLAELDPMPADALLDLGSGLGGVAIELHRRSGARIVGVDISPEAVAMASIHARRAGMDASVRFLVGDLTRPPRDGATSAYAIDSLMFVPDLPEALRGIGAVLGPGGRLFATLLVFGPGAEDRLRRSLRAAQAHIERLDDVTTALADRNHARADAATALRRHGTTSLKDRLATWLVSAEEALIRALIASGRVSRWRFVVHFGSTKERDGAHSRPVEDGPGCAQTR